MELRVQIGFPLDTTLPRDVVTINPHYTFDNPQALADALKTSLTSIGTVAASTMFTIKVYDAKKAPPSYPLATATNGTTPSVISTPREVALCLSYYAGQNVPRKRGRVYIPYNFITGSLGARPTTTQMNFVLNNWGNALFKSRPAGALPIVYSRIDKVGWTMDHLWVDDEWDTVRSRGGRATQRVQTTIP